MPTDCRPGILLPERRRIRWTGLLVRWLADNALIDDEAAARFLAGHPEPDLP